MKSKKATKKKASDYIFNINNPYGRRIKIYHPRIIEHTKKYLSDNNISFLSDSDYIKLEKYLINKIRSGDIRVCEHEIIKAGLYNEIYKGY